MSKIILGLDIGATKTSAVLFSRGNKKIIWKDTISTDKTNKKKFLKNLFGFIDRGKQEYGFSKVGVAVAGIVDVKTGKIIKAPNISIIDGINLAALLRSEFKVPVKVQNDTDCFALSEGKIGAGRKYSNFIGITLGSGVGCGLIIDKKIYNGKEGGSAGECGHMIMNMSDKKGSFEDLASGKFIKRVYGHDGEVLFADAKSGKVQAKKVSREFGENLGLGLANVINIMNPEAVIVGGGISEAIRPILPIVKTNIKRYVISPRAKTTPVVISKLGAYAPAIGAALLFE